jgi:hypothetical protein
MYVYTIYTRPLSVQAHYSRSCPIISCFCYNGSLATWTVVCLTAAKFKPLIFHYYWLTSKRASYNISAPTSQKTPVIVLLQSFPLERVCLRRCYAVTTAYTCLLRNCCLAANVVSLFVSRSLPSDGSSRCSIYLYSLLLNDLHYSFCKLWLYFLKHPVSMYINTQLARKVNNCMPRWMLKLLSYTND